MYIYCVDMYTYIYIYIYTYTLIRQCAGAGNFNGRAVPLGQKRGRLLKTQVLDVSSNV